jgi:hypothetical protein
LAQRRRRRCGGEGCPRPCEHAPARARQRRCRRRRPPRCRWWAPVGAREHRVQSRARGPTAQAWPPRVSLRLRPRARLPQQALPPSQRVLHQVKLALCCAIVLYKPHRPPGVVHLPHHRRTPQNKTNLACCHTPLPLPDSQLVEDGRACHCLNSVCRLLTLLLPAPAHPALRSRQGPSSPPPRRVNARRVPGVSPRRSSPCLTDRG